MVLWCCGVVCWVCGLLCCVVLCVLVDVCWSECCSAQGIALEENDHFENHGAADNQKTKFGIWEWYLE